MAGMFKESRSIQKPELKCSVSGGPYPGLFSGSAFSEASGFNVPSVQVTNSFRSGGRYENITRTNEEIMADAMESNFLQPFDTGHEFNSVKQTVKFRNLKDHVITNETGQMTYYGPIVTMGVGEVFNNQENLHAVVPDVNLAYGAKAIKATTPTTPSAGVSRALAELKTPIALPGQALSRIKRKRDLGQAAGGEYLNLMFGVVPTLKDIRDIFVAVRDSSKILAQYRKDAGRPIRRTHSFPDLVTEKTIYEASHQYGFNFADMSLRRSDGTALSSALNASDSLMFARSYKTFKIVETTTQKVWFSGEYLYELPIDDSVWGRLATYEREANRLLGTRFTVATFFDLAAFSWLADWFFDFGTIVHNAQNQADGLVLRYGYLMSHTVTERAMSYSGLSPFGGGQISSATTVLRTERKQRVRATPYGFGANPVSFTDTQWTILGALGLSLAPGKLR